VLDSVERCERRSMARTSQPERDLSFTGSEPVQPHARIRLRLARRDTPVEEEPDDRHVAATRKRATLAGRQESPDLIVCVDVRWLFGHGWRHRSRLGPKIEQNLAAGEQLWAVRTRFAALGSGIEGIAARKSALGRLRSCSEGSIGLPTEALRALGPANDPPANRATWPRIDSCSLWAKSCEIGRPGGREPRRTKAAARETGARRRRRAKQAHEGGGARNRRTNPVHRKEEGSGADPCRICVGEPPTPDGRDAQALRPGLSAQ
jgi:hypothetical protein